MIAYTWARFFQLQSQQQLANKKPPIKNEPPKIESNKPVLVSLDLDHTLIPWQRGNSALYNETAFLRYQHAMQNPAFKKDSFVVLNTGRGLNATKALAPFLARVPFDAIAVNDGQQLFVKPKLNASFHPISANYLWIKRLKVTQADPQWRKELKDWSPTEALRDVRDALLDFEFHPESVPRERSRHFGTNDSYVFTKAVSPRKPAHKDGWAISVLPDQTDIEIRHIGKTVPDQEVKYYAKSLAIRLKEGLRPEWPNIDFRVVNASGHYYLHVEPRKTSKASLVNYLANHRLTNVPKAIISAGDNVNDIPILTAHQLGTVPNYAIFVGENVQTRKVLSKNPAPTLEHVPWNRLDLGLEKQLQKIRPQLPPAAASPHPSTPTQLNRLV